MICHEARGRIAFIDNVRDEQIYGLFPQFQDLVDRAGISRFATRLTQFTADVASAGSGLGLPILTTTKSGRGVETLRSCRLAFLERSGRAVFFCTGFGRDVSFLPRFML